MPASDESFDDFERRARARRERRDPGGNRSRSLYATRAGRVLAASVAALLLLTVIGLFVLWPPHHKARGASEAFGGPTLGAKVVRDGLVTCPGPARQRCRRIEVKLSSGPDEGKTFPITLGPIGTAPDIGTGTSVRVSRVPEVRGAPNAQSTAAERYSFVDVDRRAPMMWLVVAFAVLVIALARWRGVLALAGVGISLLLVTKFIVPAILHGSSPALVSLVGALAVMFVTLVMTSGLGAQTYAAALGIGSSLGVATLLGLLVVHQAHLNGYSSDLSIFLNQGGVNLSLQGIVLAGMVVGALGVLSDMAVSQASAVMALRRANPSQSMRQLYRGAFTVGRDHLSATIHTLVLAYTGAALPLLLVLQSSNVGLGDALNTQDVAEPIVATLVGGIGLIAAVPVTTGLAAMLAARLPAAALPEDAHGHRH
jgi:uncharacterized membrane protein